MTSLTEITLMRQRDVERLFAATVMINPVETIRACGWLEPTVILDERIREYWGRVKAQVRPDMDAGAGVEISISTLLELGMGDALSWQNDLQMSTIPVVYANEINRRSYLSNVTTGLGKLMGAIQRADDQEAMQIISEMAGKSVSKKYEIPTAFEVAEKFAAVVNGGVSSVKTFIPKIDLATGGLERRTLTVLAGRPSTGKTALAWQIAQQAAYASSKVIFFSLEMGDTALWSRAACPRVETTWRDVRAQKTSAALNERMIEASFAHGMQFETRLRIDERRHSTSSIWQAVSEYTPDLIIVDHLRFVEDKAENEVKRLGIITQRLKDIAKAFNCAVMCLAQLNRETDKRDNKRPQLSDLRDSGEIEENADMVLMLYNETGGERKISKVPTELWLRKFRDGPRDILINLVFDVKAEWFEEVEK